MPPFSIEDQAADGQARALKIVFVCGCLEPGMDGVGDYTRLLAAELVERGHLCLLVALVDPHVAELTRGEAGTPQTPIPFLRIPAAESWPQRIAQAGDACDQFDPDWISFQVVPYAYDRRGLCFGLGRHFDAIAGDCPSEIMFHEIWIGEAEGTSLKNRLVGRLQRHIIGDLLQTLRPRVVHTHMPLYRHLLGKVGARAKLLPLFSNILCPREAKADPAWLAEKWPAGWGKINASGRGKWWIFVLFGTIHPEWDAAEFMRQSSVAAEREGKSCALLFVGRAGREGERVWRELRRDEWSSWMTASLGPQAPADISQCLLAADFGVSPVPPEYLPKSSTAMAMLEHGLPVIVTRPAGRYRNCPDQLLEPTMGNVITSFDLASARKTEPRQTLPQIAEQFVADLRGG